MPSSSRCPRKEEHSPPTTKQRPHLPALPQLWQSCGSTGRRRKRGNSGFLTSPKGDSLATNHSTQRERRPLIRGRKHFTGWLAGRRTHYHTAKRPYPRNPHAIYSASLRRYRKPRKITVAGPSISEVTKRKNPKIRGKRSQGLSQAKLSLQHRGQEHVRSRKTHCLQQVLQRYPHRWNSLLTILPAPSPLHHLPHQSSHTTPCSSLP